MTLRRGDVITVADKAGQFSGKPRPAIVLQADAFADLNTITLCMLTSVNTDAPLVRVRIEPSADLPLARPSWAEVDLITTVRRNRVSNERIGRISAAELTRLTALITVFLGIG